jgi:hypothetical protein
MISFLAQSGTQNPILEQFFPEEMKLNTSPIASGPLFKVQRVNNI